MSARINLTLLERIILKTAIASRPITPATLRARLPQRNINEHKVNGTILHLLALGYLDMSAAMRLKKGENYHLVG